MRRPDRKRTKVEAAIEGTCGAFSNLRWGP